MHGNFREQVTGKSNEELLEIYKNSEDYQAEFVKSVSEELIKRNIDTEKIDLDKQHRRKFAIEQLEKGKEGEQIYIILGFISAFLGGLIGIIMGYTYSQSKQSTNSGETYYTYNENTRKKGTLMMIVGFFVLVLSLIWKFQ